jgi:NDP-sugar pyrophosphorylase family protein
MTLSKTPITLLVLAGGLGSRYSGSKQIDGIGPNGEFLLEYAIYDALKAGFDKVVIIVNSEVKEILANRLQKRFNSLELVLVEQSTPKRSKPWGTGHAVLCAKQAIKEPFMIINADDYYGRSTFEIGANFLSGRSISSKIMGLIAFQLSKTLSHHGGVSRGVCQANDDGLLVRVEEHEGIQRQNGRIHSNQSGETPLEEETAVSMNCWLLDPSVFDHLQKNFEDFYSAHMNSSSEEYYLPTAMQQLIDTDEVDFQLTVSKEQWFGLTYAKDKQAVEQKIQASINEGFYSKLIGNG